MADIYYPSLVVNFTLRFDELLIAGKPITGKDIDELAKSPPLPQAARLSAFPALLDGTDNKTSFLFAQTPKDASINLNPYRQASQFSLTFAWSKLPIDPRLFRALGVEIHLGTVTPGQFSQGIQGPDPITGGRDSVLWTRAKGQIRQDTLLMIGIVDEYKMSHSSSGSDITISGRDIRSLFIDTPMPDGSLKDIDVTQNIAQIVLQVLSFHPFGKGIRLQVAPGEFPGGVIPSPATKDLTTQFGKSVGGGKGRGNIKGDSTNLTMWDAITYLCFACGVIPHWYGDALRLRPARALYTLLNKGGFDPNTPTPFKDSQPRVITVTDAKGNQTKLPPRSFPLMVFGKNIESFDFSRKFSGGNPKVVEITGVDPSSDGRGIQKVIKVRWPDNVPNKKGPATKASAQVSKVTPSGKEGQQDLFRYTYYGINDKNQLREIAVSLYEEISRGELSGTVSTKSLASFGGNNSDPDLLRLRVGTAVEFAFDLTPVTARSANPSVAMDIMRMEFNEAVAALKKKIPDDGLARAVVTSMQANPLILTRYFRVSDVTFKWSIQSGVEISFGYQNYVEARFDIDGPGGTAGAAQASMEPAEVKEFRVP